MNAAELWSRLEAKGLVEGERPERDAAPAPWYVRVMLGIAGWIGALFLIGFIGATFITLMDDAASAIVLGAACCGCAGFLFWKFADIDFVEQFALALSLAGQALLAFGLGNALQSGGPGLYLAIALVEAGLALAIANFLHRMLTSAASALALALAVADLKLHGLAAPLIGAALTFVWLEPRRWARHGRLWRPIGYGAVLALLLVETFRLFGLGEIMGWYGRDGAEDHWPLVGRVLTTAVLVGIAAGLAQREGHGPFSRNYMIATAGAAAAGLAAVAMPGLASALIVLLLGFGAGNRLLQALGILALLGFVSHFYYSLHATLLEKSALLAAAGVVLLAAHWALGRFAARGGETADA